MIQPNAPLEFRDGRSITKTLDDLMMSIEDLAIKGGEGVNPDLIVLPESGVPFFSANNTRATNIIDNINALSPLVANKVLESMSEEEIRSLAGLIGNKPNNNIVPPVNPLP